MIHPPRDSSSQTRPRVLIVDDDDLVRRALARILRRDFEIVTAVDAADAITKIASDVHAVVTDHDLGPGKPTGRAVLAEVRQQAPRARRVLISGERQEIGPTDTGLWHAMLVKPVNRDELLAAIGTVSSK